MRSEPIVVLGAGGHAQVVVATLLECGLSVAGLFDDDAKKWGQSILGVPVLGPLCDIPNSSQVWALLGVGSNRIRQRLAQRFLHLRWKTAIHPTAYVHSSVCMGPGTVVLAQSAVQPGSRLGAHAIVNTSAVIDHGCALADFAHVASGARVAGDVSIGEGTLLGVGASVIPGVRIGPWSTIGAGAVVVHDLDAHVTALGVPARVTSGSHTYLDRDAA
jgi:sugar O-acyltransferase (sialic acid O-acetyltransferase NeuD family)